MTTKRIRLRRSETGQVMVETAITMPVMIFLVLGGLQIMMLQHGRIMTEYAAYNAVRAGIVNNGDWGVMQNAAVIGSLPLYARTDTPREFAKAWLKVKAVPLENLETLFQEMERTPPAEEKAGQGEAGSGDTEPAMPTEEDDLP